jgi:hypothetical protein
MTVQDAQRASLRVLMAQPMSGIADYAVDPKVLGRVGSVIGGSARHDERQVRASDSHDRFTLQDDEPEEPRKASSFWLWSVSVCTLACTTASVGVLLYSRF